MNHGGRSRAYREVLADYLSAVQAWDVAGEPIGGPVRDRLQVARQRFLSASQTRYGDGGGVPTSIGRQHQAPDHELTVDQAHRITQNHIECRPLGCPAKATALRRLVQAGAMVPAGTTLAERVRRRSLEPKPAPPVDSPSGAGAMQSVLDALDKLADPDAHPGEVMAALLNESA